MCRERQTHTQEQGYGLLTAVTKYLNISQLHHFDGSSIISKAQLLSLGKWDYKLALAWLWV